MAPPAVRVLVKLMQCANKGMRLSVACAILDRAYGRPSVCTETDNDSDILFANLFENGHDEADESGNTCANLPSEKIATTMTLSQHAKPQFLC